MDDKQYHPSNSGEMQSSTPVQDERAVFRKRVLKIGGAVTLVLVGLFTLPIPFGSLKIIGSDKVTVQDVMVAGDIHEPVNILQISTEKLKTRLAKDLRVEEAQISYQLPFTMVVRVIERKAVAVVPAQFGYLTLDSKGQVIASEPAIQDTSVPMISGVKAGNILLGDTVVDKPILAALEYLNSLDESTFKNIAETSTEIINLQAIMNLPKGTEHFMTDIHGEYEAFNHVLRNGSGTIRNKIQEAYGNTLTENEKKELASIIYYPKEKVELMQNRDNFNIDKWMITIIYRLIL